MPPPPFLKQGRGAYWGRHSVSAALSLIAKTQRLGYSAFKPWIFFKWSKITKSNGGTAINWNHIGPSLDFQLTPWSKYQRMAISLYCCASFCPKWENLETGFHLREVMNFLDQKTFDDMPSTRHEICRNIREDLMIQMFREMQGPRMNMAYFGCPGQDPQGLSP